MGEYIFDCAKLKTWQKWLNQWKHEFHIAILHCSIEKGENEDHVATILLKRSPRSKSIGDAK